MRLELYERKRSRTVLRGLERSNALWLPDAIHEGVCVFVSMGGPCMAVEAIRAKFSKGEIVNCTPWDAPAIELTAGEGNTGMYHDYMQNIPEAKFTSLILCHDLLVNPNYGGKSTTFILRTDEAQAAAKLKHNWSRCRCLMRGQAICIKPGRWLCSSVRHDLPAILTCLQSI
jgi:hypothetical protein